MTTTASNTLAATAGSPSRQRQEKKNPVAASFEAMASCYTATPALGQVLKEWPVRKPLRRDPPTLGCPQPRGRAGPPRAGGQGVATVGKSGQSHGSPWWGRSARAQQPAAASAEGVAASGSSTLTGHHGLMFLLQLSQGPSSSGFWVVLLYLLE